MVVQRHGLCVWGGGGGGSGALGSNKVVNLTSSTGNVLYDSSGADYSHHLV